MCKINGKTWGKQVEVGMFYCKGPGIKKCLAEYKIVFQQDDNPKHTGNFAKLNTANAGFLVWPAKPLDITPN